MAEVEVADNFDGLLVGDEGGEVGDEVAGLSCVPDVHAFGGFGSEDDVVEMAEERTFVDELGRGAECEDVPSRVAFDANANGHDWD